MSKLHEELESLAPEQRELLAALMKEQGLDEGALLMPVERKPEGLPLSSAQQRMWFLQQLRPTSPFYNVHAALRLTGKLKVECLVHSLNEFVRRHEPLRTVFPSAGGQPLQRILAPAPAALEQRDLSGVPAQEREAEVYRAVEHAALASFDLEREPPCRFLLVRVEPEEHVLVFATHHIAADGWSLGVFVQELCALYTAAVHAEPPALPPLRLQYADFAAWERSRLKGGRERELLEYWQEQLAGLPDLSTLPPERPRPPLSKQEGATFEFALPPHQVQALRSLAQARRTSLFSVLLAAFQWLLARCAGQDDVALGMPIANRNRKELEGLIGCFASTLVLRAKPSASTAFTSWLAQVSEQLHGALEHQEVPFERLVEVLQPRRRMDRHPLFQIFLAMQQHPLRRAELPGLLLSEFPLRSRVARFDLEFHLWESAQGVEGTLIYDVDLYGQEGVAQLVRRYVSLLEAVAADPTRTLGELAGETLAPPVRKQVLALSECPPLPRPSTAPRTLAEALLQTAERFPTATVSFVQAQGSCTAWTLPELVERARRLQAGLRQWGLRPGDSLVLVLGREEETVEALWACVLAGVAPLVLPAPPARAEASPALSRLRHARQLLGGPRVLTRQEMLPDLARQLQVSPTADILGAVEELRATGGEAPLPPGRMDDVALLNLTSGTTGKAKCAMLTHRNLLVRLEATNVVYESQPLERGLVWLQLHNIGALSEYHLRPLCAGMHTFHAPTEEVLAEPLRWLEWLERYGIAQTWAPSFAYSHLLERLRKVEDRRWSLGGVRVLLSAGEQISAPMVEELMRRLAPSGVREDAFVAAWGMTETASGVTYARRPGTPPRMHTLERASLSGPLRHAAPASPTALRLMDVGAPIAGTALRVVDASGELLSEECVGRIQVRGEMISPGYYGDPKASAALLTADGWLETGDLGFLSEGALTITGRAKDLVIIHGTNFSCYEIESAVEQVEGVAPSSAAAAAVRMLEGSREELAVFFVPTEGLAPQPPASLLSRIRQQVLEQVGVRIDHLIPLEPHQLPRTEGGKLRRSELRARFEAGELRAPQPAPVPSPSRPLEQLIASVWAEVLEHQDIAPEASFFDLGGNSILLVRVERALRARLGLELTLMDLFAYPTVHSLADYLEPRAAQLPAQASPPTQAERRRGMRGAALEQRRTRRQAQRDED
uniref:TubE protein n=1 Tax=Archangium disciforme TaxID=38 RepID=Q5ZPA7_9BACT|nr:TubE protein [Archangium disciforme]